MTRSMLYRVLTIGVLFVAILSACGGAAQQSATSQQTQATSPSTDQATSVAAVPTTGSTDVPTTVPTRTPPTSAPNETQFAVPSVVIKIPPTIAIPSGPKTPTPSNATAEATLTEAAPTDAATSAAATSPAATSAATSTASSITDTLAVLGAGWQTDSDGNSIPDALEVAVGADPKHDDCTSKQCGDAGDSADLLTRERNILMILDSSGSMAAPAGGGESKIDAAKGALKRFVNVVSDVYHLGFLVYGHKGNNTDAGKAESCAGIDLLAPIGKVDRASFPALLDQFQPTGWTPIAAALTEAQKAFAGQEQARNRIVLVSDGIETCDGDPVAVAQQMFKSGIAVQIDVIGLDIDEGSPDAAQLRKIAEVTNGSYYDAKTAADLDNYFRQQGEQVSKTYNAMTCEVSNFGLADICDSRLVNKARAKLRELIAAEPSGSPKEKAYQALSGQIDQAYTQRQQARAEAQARYEQLKQHYFDLRDQLQKALHDTYINK